MVAPGVNFGSSRTGTLSRSSSDLVQELRELAHERNAVILAHNYQVPELQEAADFVGDSLGLSYQAAKPDADIICTSGNADKIVREAPEDRQILFVPDQNLGAWVMERTERKMDLWQGTCYVHVEFTARSINRIREEYLSAPVVAHPECTYAVRQLAY